MSDNEALSKERAQLIQKMLEMQKKFIDIEHATGVDPKDYYAPESGTYMEEYRREYNNLATRVNKLAHQIKESGHIH